MNFCLLLWYLDYYGILIVSWLYGETILATSSDESSADESEGKGMRLIVAQGRSQILSALEDCHPFLPACLSLKMHWRCIGCTVVDVMYGWCDLELSTHQHCNISIANTALQRVMCTAVMFEVFFSEVLVQLSSSNHWQNWQRNYIWWDTLCIYSLYITTAGSFSPAAVPYPRENKPSPRSS